MAEKKKVRMFATTFGIKAARLVRKHKKGIQPPNTEYLFFFRNGGYDRLAFTL